MNEQGKIVLSILYTDPDDSSKFKDGHFFIHESNQVKKIRFKFSEICYFFILSDVFIKCKYNF
jgi:hypothetical protein